MVASRESNTALPWRWSFPLDSPVVESGASAPHARAAGVAVWLAGSLFERERHVAVVPPTASDATFVLEAYRAHGLKAVAMLRGRFAVAISDTDQGRTIVARDHAGLQPVFYRLHDGRVVCAPSAAALASMGDGRVRFNRPAIADAVCRRFPILEETFFADVRRLPGGSLATIARGRMDVARYWEPIPLVPTREAAAPATAEELEFARRRAIRRCAGSDAVAILLSGGLDSVSIAAALADDARTEGHTLPLALSLGIPAPDSDERAVQRSVAASLALPFRLLDFHQAAGAASLVAQALDLNGDLSSPLMSPWEPPYRALARTARDLGRTVILTGIGGDEFFSSSPYVAADRLLRGDIRGARRFIDTYGRSQTLRRPWWTMAIRPMMQAAAESAWPGAMQRRRAGRRLAADPGWLPRDPLLTAGHVRRAGLATRVAPWRMGFARAEIRSLILDHPFSSIEMEEHDELGRLSGVTYRHPYLDPDLIDVLCRASPDVVNRDGWLKGVLRAPLAARFPGCGFDTQRKGLVDGFYRDTVFADGVAERRVRSGLPALASLGILDEAPAVAGALEWIRSPRAFNRAWHLLSLESWVDARQRASRSVVHSEGVGVAS